MNKNWKFLNTKWSKEQIREIRTRFDVTSAMAIIMLNRGVTAEKAEEFLERSTPLYDPFLLCDMDKACARIKSALENSEKITVYGDYDVDGITAVAIMMRYLKSVGANCDYYIPNREGEGYGVNSAALNEIKEGGSSLVITVDTGITAVTEVDYAKSIGLDMVVTDHHTVKDVLPAACAVINPKRNDCQYPFKELSGAGVAFKLVCALNGDSNAMFEKYSDLVALSAIADVVPLMNENRTIAYNGIEKMRNSLNPGINALMNASKIVPENVTSRHLAFGIAPRINAAGRIDCPKIATSLLLTDDVAEAEKLSLKLDETNEIRKQIGNEIYEEAETVIEERGISQNKVIVVEKDDWHQGVIGIIASKLSEKYNRPVILLSSAGDHIKGSGRSVDGFDLFEGLNHCKDLLIKFGGHKKAAGLSLDRENIGEFSKKINEYAETVFVDENLIPELYIDMPLEMNGSLLKLLDDMERLEPYGVGNEQPVFAVLDGRVQSVRYSRDGKHIFLKILKNGKIVDAVGFGMGDIEESSVKKGTTISIAAKLYKNEYNGSVFPQFQIIDIRW